MISVLIVGDKQAIDRMKSRQDKLVPELEKTMKTQAISLVGYIKRNKLQSSPLHHRSGRLQSSIKQAVNKTANMILAKVYTNVEYARIHEYGGKTSPHIIMPKKASVLAFTMGGKQIFAKHVNHPGSRMPQRSFMRSSLSENSQKIRNAINNTIQEVMRAA